MDTTKERKSYAVTVIYNGVEREVEGNPKAAVQALLQHSIREHGVVQNPHILSLFTEAGAELNDNASPEDQEIASGARLLLRPSAVKGGR